MRLFIAVRFPNHIRKSLQQTMADLRRKGVRGNFSRVENLHLTLAFLGEVQDPEPVCEAMNAAEAAPFSLKLSESGAFKDLYWVGIAESPKLAAYAEGLRAELRSREIWFDEKAFKPHITIVRRARHEGKIQIPVHPETFTVSRVSLMKSEHRNGKLIYTEIYAVDLSKFSRGSKERKSGNEDA